MLDAGRLVLDEELDAIRVPTGRTLVRTPTRPRCWRCWTGGGAAATATRCWCGRRTRPALNARLVEAGIRVTELAVQRRSLEQVVLELTGDGLGPGRARRRAEPAP